MDDVFGAVGAARNHKERGGDQRPQSEFCGFPANGGDCSGWDGSWEGDAAQFLSLPPWEAIALSVTPAERLRHRRIQTFIWCARKIRTAAKEFLQDAMTSWSHPRAMQFDAPQPRPNAPWNLRGFRLR
jgi:hypothetical protein